MQRRIGRKGSRLSMPKAAMARSISGCAHLYLLRVRPQMIVDPAGENRCFPGHHPWLRKSFHPAIQVASCCSDFGSW